MLENVGMGEVVRIENGHRIAVCSEGLGLEFLEHDSIFPNYQEAEVS